MDYIGKILLVAISYYRPDGELIGRKQIAGTIAEMAEDRVVIKKLDDGESFNLPPDGQFIAAKPGVYTLNDGNVESVSNPDFTCFYSVIQQKEHSRNGDDLANEGFTAPQD